MTTMKFLLEATNQTYDSDALGYIAGLEEGGINKAAQIIGISAGAIAGAMAEERMDYGLKQRLIDKFAEYGRPLDEEEIRLVPTMSDITAQAVAVDHISLTPRTHEAWVADYEAVKGQLDTISTSIQNKLLHPSLIDAGPSNMRIAVAIRLVNEYASKYTDLDLSKYLNNYPLLVSDLMNETKPLAANLYGLYLKEAEKWFIDNGAYGGQWDQLPQEFRDALLVTFVNRGVKSMTDAMENLYVKKGLPYEPLPAPTVSAGMNHLLNAKEVGQAIGLSSYGTDAEGVTSFAQDALVQGDSGLAYRYALYRLRCVALSGLDYSASNQNGELDLYNPDTGQGTMTEAYVQDRALMVERLYLIMNTLNPDNQGVYQDTSGTISFFDTAQNITIQTTDSDPKYIFGDTKSNTLTGGSLADHLYGMKGNDILIVGEGDDYIEGGLGNDYLVGGAGDDTLIGGEGEDTYVISGHDRIIDTGRNFIVWNGRTIAGEFKAEEGNPGMYRFESDDNEWSLVFHSPGQLTLSAEDSVTFVNQTSAAEFADHDFGITLQEEDPDEFDITLTGSASRNEMGIFDIGLDQKNWQLYFVSFPDPHWVNLHGSGWSDDPASWQDPEDENSPVILYEENLPEIAPRMKISGGDEGDFLFGFARHDEITGGAGGDIINGYVGYWKGKELTQSGDLEGDLLDGGDGGDWIHGAGADDQLIGGGGNDLLTGLDGDDSIRGDEGNDVLAGGSHADTLSGGDGDDILLGEGYFTGSLELTLDNLASLGFDLTGPGADYYTGYTTIGFAIHNDAPNGGEDVLLGGAGRDWLEGGAGADILDGGTESDSLFGGEGDDWLSGGEGNDWMVGDSLDPAIIGDDIMLGSAGDDTYIVNSIDDIIIEEAGEGTDTVQSSVSYTLPENVEYITFTGSGDLNATGNALDNLLSGTSGANILFGNAGNDTLDGFADNDILDGGEGLDWMTGGLGDDTYVVDNTGDVVAENAGEGIDTVQSSITYTLLGANVENLVLTGSDDINGTGDGLNNVITGNSTANILDGGAGSDTLIGGAGNDTYMVDVSTDVITENASEGNDTVVSGFSSTLGANIENLFLTGATDTDGNRPVVFA